MKGMGHAVSFLALLGVLVLGFAQDAQAYNWSVVVVDTPAHVGDGPSIAVGANGDPMISYGTAGDLELKFAICARSASTNGNCDQTDDWNTVTVDGSLEIDPNVRTSIAVDSNGEDPLIGYTTYGYGAKFAICDRSASTNGNCDQSDDWSKVDVGYRGRFAAIAVAPNGDLMMSYEEKQIWHLKFAICDRSASTNGNCDQSGDWNAVTVDGEGVGLGAFSDIAVGANGDPMISYHADENGDLKFAICDVSASTNGNCDQTSDWNTMTVDATGVTGVFTSIAAGSDGDPMISYHGGVRFAICDRSASTNGNCDQTGDWSTVELGSGPTTYYPIAVDANGDPKMSHPGVGSVVTLSSCDRSSSTNGNCDQADDWVEETTGDARAEQTSIALDENGYPMIPYHSNAMDLGFVTAQPRLAPVGGIAELPDVSAPSTHDYAALAGLAAMALVALTAGTWYARRRWLR